MSSRYFKITDYPGFPTRIIRDDRDGAMYERVNGEWKWNTSGILPDLQGDRLVSKITKDQAEG
jgi:hypothetical protein